MKRCRLVLLFGLLLTFAGCNTLMPMLFGFREINGYDAEAMREILSQAA